MFSHASHTHMEALELLDVEAGLGHNKVEIETEVFNKLKWFVICKR